MVVIQEIQSMWTKDSRGVPGASARNALPERLRFTPPTGREAVFEHLAHYSEHEGFVARETVRSYDAPVTLRYGCVKVVVDVNHAEVIWKYDPYYIGAPGRYGPPKEVFVCGVGQWGSVRYNGRLTQDEGGWWYRKVVINVGVFTSAVGSEFLTGGPNFTYDQMARLW